MFAFREGGGGQLDKFGGRVDTNYVRLWRGARSRISDYPYKISNICMDNCGKEGGVPYNLHPLLEGSADFGRSIQNF